MKDYNPKLAAKKNNPEQLLIKNNRNIEFDRQFKRTSEQKLNQEYPNPQGFFNAEVQGVARAIVEKASSYTNKKKKGEINNAEYSAEMANIQQMVGNLKSIKNVVNANLAAYNNSLKNGTLSYGMDQFDEAVLVGLNRGEINLDLDEDNRVKLTGKANSALDGNFDVNIYDAINVPAPVNRIDPLNLLLDPYVKGIGLDSNGQPMTKVDENGQKILDTGDISEHKLDNLEFIQDAISTVGDPGLRSFLGDHMNLQNKEIKNLVEHLNFNDGDHEWRNAAEARAFQDLNEYIENKYQRQRKPHPDTLASNVSNQASKIAAGKQVVLEPDNITTPTAAPMAEPTVLEPQVAQEPPIEEVSPNLSPFTYKEKSKNKALELIKKYSA